MYLDNPGLQGSPTRGGSESGSVAELWFECRIPGRPLEGADHGSARCQAPAKQTGPDSRCMEKTGN